MTLLETSPVDATVLVVDDQPDVRFCVRAELELHGLEVLESARGDDALAMLHHRSVDVVLLDVDIPGLDGYEVLDAVQDDPSLSEVPVVFLTAQDAPDDVARALRGGAHDHIGKPFHGDELRARVDAAVRTKRHHDDLRRRNARLLEESRTDVLTGLGNRRLLEAELDRLAAAARRHGHRYTVGMLDLDHFKAINDTWGHGAGDEVLAGLARAMQAQLRTEDVAGRWGGEEFLMLLPMTRLDGGFAVVERVRAWVARHPVLLASGEHVPVTVSAGCAEGSGDPDAVLARADRALYRAKATGRNQVVVDERP